MLNACLIVSDHIFVLSSQNGDLVGHNYFLSRKKIISSSAQNLLAWVTDQTKLLVIHCEPMQILVLGLRFVYQDLSTCHGWPVNKAIVNLPIRLKGNSKRISSNLLSILETQNKDMGTALQTLCFKPVKFCLRYRLQTFLTQGFKRWIQRHGILFYWVLGIFEGSHYFQSLYNPWLKFFESCLSKHKVILITIAYT